MTTLLHRASLKISFGICLLPLVWVAGILLLTVRARVYLGYWPRPSHPDPKLLPFDLHHASLWGVFVVLKWSLVVLPVLYLTNKYFLKKQMNKKPLQIYGWGWLVIIALVFLPHVNFVEWFLD